MDVRLSDATVVQPDVLYVSPDRTDRIGEQEIEGAPDLVMEVVSPSTSHRDAFDKKRLYERHGVREYWIVDPDTETNEGTYPTTRRTRSTSAESRRERPRRLCLPTSRST